MTDKRKSKLRLAPNLTLIESKRAFTPMCDCSAVNPDSKGAVYMKPTASKDGKTCDHCGYIVFRQYPGVKPDPVYIDKSKKPVTISEWHKRDK